ncbi:MAG: bifunctional UDP-N-acetylglucosamine diphosphorylase/glucosamine-1-phosphate N-acetyltransferase GlmU [Actinobacteria bacterium]|nr:bifunctional UDP-N-acetylglucosamine diphosphorylase/glucosamine-1-phosphate N-acetyltransferase GlmU [Actinomycetota bacterium]
MSVTALILAAGEGTRMKSALPKVAHRVLGKPMVEHVVSAARAAGAGRVVVVTGHGAEAVEALMAGSGVDFVRQDEQHGTGHAVMCAEVLLGAADGSLLVVAGDCPLFTPETLASLVAERDRTGAAAVVLTTRVDEPAGYGRIVRDSQGAIAGIVEDRDLSPEQRAITEINTSTYCFDAAVLFEHLRKLENANAQGEYYLTDIVGILNAEGLAVRTVEAQEPLETLGVNTRVQLAEASRILQRRINERHMLAGVTMTDPDLVWIGPDVAIGRDVVIEPMTTLMGATTVGDGCVLGPDTRVTDSTVGSGCVVDSSIVSGAVLADRVRVGPRAYLRPGTQMGEGSKAGTCVEIKDSRIGAATKVPHLSYIGDADIGSAVNIGAGTITCNYDGERKHRTVVGDGAFIGSDTMLVAPVEVGRGAVTGAGSVIAHDVPADALAVERTEQRTVEGWAARRRETAQDEG